MGYYDDDSNQYASSPAAYQSPQAASYPTPSSPSATAPQSPVYYQGPAPSAPPSGGSWGGGWGSWGGLGGAVQGLANGVANAINNHPLTLTALGAGIAQGGIGQGLSLASSAAQAERNLQAQQVNHSHVLNALTGAGVPPDEALAAVMNPSLMRVLAVKYLGPRSGGNAGAAAGAAAGSAPPQGNATSYSPNTAYGASNNAAAPSPVQGRATGAPSALLLPPGVPDGSSYSHTRRTWRDGSGNLFDPLGKAVA